MDEPPESGTFIKVPPHSLDAEQGVLGGLLQNQKFLAFVQPILNPEDFYAAANKTIYKCMCRLADEEQPIDVLTVSESLESLNQLDKAGGMEYLAQLAGNTPGAANVEAWADIIVDRAKLRRLAHVAHDISDSCYNTQGRKAEDVLVSAEEKVFAIGDERQSSVGPRPIRDVLTETVRQIDRLSQEEDTITGLATGFNDLDELTSGLQPSDMIVIAARPSMGKTSLAMNIAERAVMEGDQMALVFSMEMPAESLVMRVLSSLSRVDQTKVRNGQLSDKDWPRLTSSVTLLNDKKLYIDDTPALTPADIRSRARRLISSRSKDDQVPLGLIVVDYLQLMQTSTRTENRVGEISEISRSLKAIAREFNCPLLALSQLNRSLEQRPDKRPVMSDLRESGAIEQDADVILAIYRDEVYHPDEEEDSERGTAEILILKQRNGPIGRIKLAFQGEFTRFDNLARGYEDYEY